jgi:inorganic pyrophosphatase
LKSYTELPEVLLKQIEHFFAHYKDLEPNKWVKIAGWADIEAARKEIMDGVSNYAKADVKPEF